jgi:thioredoxin 1
MSETRQSVEDGRPVTLDGADDLDDLVSNESVALVEFYTAGCGICQSMEPVLGNVAKTTDAVVATINPRDDPPLVERFAVQSVPLFVVFVDGEPVARRAEGFVPGDELRAWLAEFET